MIIPEIPYKLRQKLLKQPNNRREAFVQFLTAIEIFFPQVKLCSQERYSALYIDGKPIVYIEPQKIGIKIVFFTKYLATFANASELKELSAFPQWNKSKGGMKFFAIRANIIPVKDELILAAKLFKYSLRSANG